MTATARAGARPQVSGTVAAVARRLIGPALVGGLFGGLLMIGVMILVMGYASPLNLGMPAFVYTIAPPPAMLPALIAAMGISLPASAMAQVAPTFACGRR